jgi:hypothetical protein
MGSSALDELQQRRLQLALWIAMINRNSYITRFSHLNC